MQKFLVLQLLVLDFSGVLVFLSFFLTPFLTMQEVDRLVQAGALPEGTAAQEALEFAWREVNKLLEATGESLAKICSALEAATSREGLREVFRRFNAIMRMFTDTVPAGTDESLVLKAVASFESSHHFSTLLSTESCVTDVVAGYKRLILRKLAASLRRKEDTSLADDRFDDELFETFLPQSPGVTAAVGSAEARTDAPSRLHTPLTHPTGKRGVSSVVVDLVGSPLLKRSRVPALASLGELAGVLSSDKTAKKRILMTRAKLRAATHDPKGLLSLVDSSTNALERTKRLELLKSAGYEFSSEKKYGRSFAEKIKAATLQLDLGLGGHSSGDALSFGAKVLSIPRFLSFKNISDIENSVVDGNTT